MATLEPPDGAHHEPAPWLATISARGRISPQDRPPEAPMTPTIQQQVARQLRVAERTPQSPLLAYHAARDKLAFLLSELEAATQQTAAAEPS